MAASRPGDYRSMRIALMTIGTQGDVQPFVALALRLKSRGHDVVLATPGDFEAFVSSYGVPYQSLGGNIQALLSQARFDKAMSAGALSNVPALLRQGLELVDAAARAGWQAAQGADLLVLNMNTSFGIDFGEALGIPVAMLAPQPLVPTGDFPLCIFGGRDMGRVLNRLSYSGMNGQQAYFNRARKSLRKDLLGLGPLRRGGFFRDVDGSRLTVLHCYSPLVSPRPADWPGSAHVTGYFRLADNSGWQPSEAFRSFLAAGEAPVYIGFGSMPFGAERNTAILNKAIALWGGRAVVARGWGGIDPSALPASVFAIDHAPHDRLFAHVRAVVHHGGAGTTSAGLHLGRPSFVVPQTVDQPFWANRVHALGCGPTPVPLKALTPETLAANLTDLVSDPDYALAAERLAFRLAEEDGTAVASAILEDLAVSGRRAAPKD
jgi:sterol 3beta-glucosyltransferase